MQNVIRGYLEQAKIGRKQSHKNLAMFPLLSDYTTSLDYMTLDEAMSERALDVTEVDERGSVPKIKVFNRTARRVLILDGEELVGAKQNRIVNTTIIIEANSTTVIPVSCVEQGRWEYKSSQFYSHQRIMPAELRAIKADAVHASVKRSGDFQSDQGALWQGIDEKAKRMRTESPTMAMADMYEKESSSLEDYTSHFRPAQSQVGAVFAVNGAVAGLDSFAKPQTFSSVFKKLLESYALDAVDRFDPEREQKASRKAVTDFKKASLAAPVESHPSVALGTDCRINSKKVTGFGLVLDEQVLHLSIFARGVEGNEKGYRSGMERFSERVKRRD